MAGHKPYSKINRKVTPQSQPIFGSNQVPNTAGGYGWALDDWKRLERFLVLGSESGTYYISEQVLTLENAEATLRCIKADGPRVVRTLSEISQAGRAPKNDPALFVLALCFSYGNDTTKRAAANALTSVARIGTHLFHFAEFVQNHRGWGRLLRNAVAKWYTSKDIDDLAFQVVKYRQRDGWTHRDLLRLSHPRAEGRHNTLFRYLARKDVSFTDLPATVQGYETLAQLTTPEFGDFNALKVAAKLVADYRLPMECVPSELVGFDTWTAALPHLGLTALIRNLGNLSKYGVLSESEPVLKASIVERLTDEESLRRARVHPIQILAALITYKQGMGMRGKGTWNVVPDVVDALDEAFYKAFANVSTSGKRLLLGIDVSGSMTDAQVNGIPGLTCTMAAAAMALVTWKTEKNVAPILFDTEGYIPDFSRRSTLAEMCAVINQHGGGTDCSIPIRYATKYKIPVDTFVIYTDNETWQGHIHPAQALEEYRKTMNIPARLISVGMSE